MYYNIKSSNLCTFCNDYKENVNHLFFECERTQLLYKEMNRWLQITCGIGIPFTKCNILLGIFPVQCNNLQNVIVLYFKRYVYITRCKNKSLNSISLKEFIKHNIRVEKMINIDKWTKKWGIIGTSILNS